MKNNKIVTANRVIYQAEIFPELKLDFGSPVNRHSFVIAFIAKAIWNIAKTKDLIAYLQVDKALRVICGFDSRNNVIPSESSFSREFARLSKLCVADKMHKYLVVEHCSNGLYEHLAFDASAIEVAEKAKAIDKKERTIEAQRKKSTSKIIADLPAVANFGTKKNSNGNNSTWKGYKLHSIVNECNVPVASLVTSASVHDSLCAIPLIRSAEERVDALYYLGDKAYDALAIRAEIESLGKVPLIDYKRNRSGELNREFIGNQINRYKKRTFVESLFSQLKMNHLPSYILYQGIEKIRSVLSFALTVITAMQIIKYS